MSNKRNRAVLEEDEYVEDYIYPSDNCSDEEDPTQLDSSFLLLRANNFSSHGPQGNSSSSSMAPAGSSSSAALSSNDEFYAKDDSFFIDGVEHRSQGTLVGTMFLIKRC